MKKRILLIGPFPPPITGEAIANQTLVSFLNRNNIDFEIINTTNTNQVSSSHGQFAVSKVLYFFKAYSKTPKVLKYNILYITIGQTFFGVIKYAPFILLANLFNKPYYLHLHGNYLGTMYANLSPLKRRVVHRLLSNAKAAIVLSESLKSNFSAIIPTNRIPVVGNFALDKLYELDISQKNFDYLRVVYMSNLMREKGIIDLLNALSVLQANDIKFVAHIAGSMEVGIQQEVREAMAQIDSESLIYHGVVNGKQKESILLESNVFVLPTFYKIEGQPISIIEALATGNIIVTTHQGGIPDLISSDHGFFVEKGNYLDLAARLTDLSENITEYKLMGARNKEYARSHFTEELFGSKILQIFDEY